MYGELLAAYYDSIYSNKDYDKEVAFIRSLLPSNFKFTKVLDVGCGTGEHLRRFLDLDGKVELVGVDYSPYMIEVAKGKKDLENITFINADASKVPQYGFDLITSMFNVVNHIETLGELNKFFKTIREKIKKNHFFIFDSWNGIAATRSLPVYNKRVIQNTPVGTIKVEYHPKIDLMNSTVKMINNVDILNNKGYIIDNIEYELTHILWTPKVLKDLLKMNGFEVKGIYRGGYEEKAKAQYEDYKIIFLCEAV